MKATSLFLIAMLSVTSAQAFPGAAPPQPGAGHAAHGLGRFGGAVLVPDSTPAVETPAPPAVERRFLFGAPGFGPPYPWPYFIPLAHPWRFGPHMIYYRGPFRETAPKIYHLDKAQKIDKPQNAGGARVIYLDKAPKRSGPRITFIYGAG